MTTALVLAFVAYLIGSLSFAVIASRAFALPDPRSYGSRNPGATNVLRTGKKAAAVLTLIGDSAKGWLAVVIAAYFAEPGLTEVTMAASGVAALLGHIFPVFFRFEGGKGVSTALGVLIALNLYVAAAAIASWLIVFVFFRISSLSALVAALCAPFITLILYNAAHPFFIGIAVISALLVWRHAPNIRNLLQGTEDRIGSSTTGR
jgi:glycerol-3-phosphate acyltransferase PlsY